MLKKLFTVLLCVGLVVSAVAQLPKIDAQTGATLPTTLPATLKLDGSQQVYIDMDDDKILDFIIWMESSSGTSGSSGSSGSQLRSSFWIIHNDYSSPEKGSFLCEARSDDMIVIGHEEDKQVIQDKFESRSEYSHFVASFEEGTIIGPEAPMYHGWDFEEEGKLIMDMESGHYYSPFFDNNNVDADVNKNGAYDELENTGYMGLRYQKGSGSQYGWLQVQVNSNDNSVTILGKGVAPKPDEPVAAGDLPAVPLTFLATFLGLGIIGIGAARRRKKN